MPLVRVEVRNEYALGAPELYREANKEDPKGILEGISVAGLVGVLRQLGDLAEFAAEVFHGLQEEVTVTSSRSCKLMARVQRIEAALSPLEKAVLAQRSHLHFAYTAGSNWHTRIRCEQNHFIYSDVPQFIMDSYEDCRGPPRLHLLDKFDPDGPGSCLKRYSDPTFFKRASVASGEANTAKISKNKKGRKMKRRRSWSRKGEVSQQASFSCNSDRMQFTQLNIGGPTSPSQTASTYDTMRRSDLGEQPNSDLRNGSGYIEGDFRPSYSVQTDEQESRESISSPVKRHSSDCLDYNFLGERITDAYDDIQINLSQEQAGCRSSSVTWDENREILEPTMPESDKDDLIQENDRNGHLESFSSPVKRHGSDSLDYNFLGERITDACDDIQINISREQAGCRSSSVTWDENRETVESTMQESDKDDLTWEDDHNRHLESFSPNLDLQTLGDNAVGFEAVEKMDVQSCNQAVPTMESGDDCLDDIETETDHFMDALNTIESECETDIDCTKKQEVEYYSKLEDKGVDDGECELITHNLECKSSSIKSNVSPNSSLINGSCGHDLISMFPESPNATKCSINGVAAKDEFNSVSPVDKDLQSSQRVGESLTSGSPQSVDSCENSNIDTGNNVKSVSCALTSSLRDGKSVMPITDGTSRSPEPEKHAPETPNVTSVTFWTNGGLLGLQPSKPPDCSVLNTLPQDSVYKKDGDIHSSIQHHIISGKHAAKPDQTENFENIEEGLDKESSTCHEYQESGTSFRKPSWKISPSDLDIKLGTLGGSLHQNKASSTGSSVMPSGSFLPVNSAFQAAREYQENSSSSRIFEISNRLLSTGSSKKLLPGRDENYYLAGHKNSNAFDQKNQRAAAYRTISGRSKDIFGGESPTLSPSSSPPLEHMKISFQPMDGFETSKLKLKFSNGNSNSESGSDVFPSFQLVPEVSIARHNVGSDSDADTFYRSSPSLSDDCGSNQSESNSEQWESSESPTSKDHDFYDVLHRISLSESVSTVPGNGRTDPDITDNSGFQYPCIENGLQNSDSCRSFDIQSLGSTNHSFRKELRNDTNRKDLVEQQLAPTRTPPLPPVQWRGTRPHLDGIEDKREAMPEGSYYAFDLKLSASTISQPKPAPLNEDQIVTANMQKSKQSKSKKSTNGQREANRGKSSDEKEDFLHQIRTKSFNLRPTVTAKSTVPSEGSATVQVSAILEKANAIRQAVGSDREDDGNWSDT